MRYESRLSVAGYPRPVGVPRNGEHLALVLFTLCTLLLCITLPAQGQTSGQSAGSTAAGSAGINVAGLDARAESILRSMTLEEKVGQLVQYSAGQPTGPGTGRTDYNDMIGRGQIGALLNVIAPSEINAYQRIAVEKSRLHIPILFGLDVIHGFKTEFPIPLGLASTWDPAIVEKASRVAAVEASANGIRWTFSPMVDIARDARWGRMAEGAGEDPFLGADGCRVCARLSRCSPGRSGQHRRLCQTLRRVRRR